MAIATTEQLERYQRVSELLLAHPGVAFNTATLQGWAEEAGVLRGSTAKDLSSTVNALSRPEEWSVSMRQRWGLKGWVMPLRRGLYLYDPDAVTTFTGHEDWVIKSPAATKLGYEDGYPLRGHAKRKLWLAKIGEIPPGKRNSRRTAEPVEESFVQSYPAIASGFDLVEVLARTEDGLWVVRDADGKATVLRAVE